MTSPIDQLVESYLDAVRRATADLSPARRDDLLADLADHIATARAELSPETEAGVQEILGRLGDAEGIAAEARLGNTPAHATPRPAPRANRTALYVVAGVLAALIVLCGAGTALLLVSSSTHPVKAVPVEAPAPASSAGG